MTDNDIAMIAELRQWNKDNGIPLKQMWKALEEVYAHPSENISSVFYDRMKRGKYMTRGRKVCTRTNEDDVTRIST